MAKKIILFRVFVIVILLMFVLMRLQYSFVKQEKQLQNQNVIVGMIVKKFRYNCVVFNNEIGYVLIPACEQNDLYKVVFVSKLKYASNFWKHQGIFLQGLQYFVPKLEALNKLDKWQYKILGVFRWFFVYKRQLFDKINQYVSSEVAGILLGMLFGSELFLSQDVKQLFKNLSLMHVLVVSGYNIQLVLGYFHKFVKNFVRYTIRQVFLIFLAVLFVPIVGLSPPVVRAVVSFVIDRLLDIFGIKLLHFDKLILVVFIILWIIPYWVFSLSFHLSVLATIGVQVASYFAKRIKILILEKVKFVSRFVWLNKMVNLLANFVENASITIGVIIFTAPILYWKLGVMPSNTGLFANIILLPLIEVISVLGYFLFPLVFVKLAGNYLGLGLYSLIIGNLISLLLFLMQQVNLMF